MIDLRLYKRQKFFEILDRIKFYYPKNPLCIIYGRPDTGKTDLSLFIAETLLINKVIHWVGTNIDVFRIRDFVKITNTFELKRFLMEKRGKKLVILDEAGLILYSRDAMSKLNKELVKLCFILRKFRSSIIFVLQDIDVLDKHILNSNLINCIIEKIDKKIALIRSVVTDVFIMIEDIPKTIISYDTYDIAKFTFLSEKEEEKLKQSLKVNPDDLKLIKKWVELNLSFTDLAKQLNLKYGYQAKRKVMKALKNILNVFSF